MQVIRRIDIGSAFKTGAMTTMLMWLVIGLPVMALVGFSTSSTMASFNLEEQMGFAAIASIICVAYVCGVLVYAIIGGVTAALGALFYNLSARWFGGLKVELEAADGKQKRSDDYFSLS